MFINPSQTVQDLRDAADYMREHPWVTHMHFDGQGGCCAFGALITVTGDRMDDLYRRERSSNAARAFYRVMGTDVATYNDTESRTKEQVIRALETVADALEKDPSRA